MSIAARRLQRGVLRNIGSTHYSLWPSNPTPGVIAEADNSSVELGVKFKSATVASVLGIRFYKSAANTGTHVGSLWTDSGTLLASATFSGETASGWQEVYFAAPAGIAANTNYVASYFTPTGYYSADSNYFVSNGVTSGILTAPSNIVTPNGVYKYSVNSAFPDSSFGATNYWVDVIVASIADTVPPTAPSSLAGVATGSLVDLTWVASTDDVGVQGYRIYRDGLQIGTSSTTSYSDTTANPTTNYDYTVRAIDYGNNISEPSNIENITTGANANPVASFSSSSVGFTAYVDGGASSDTDGTIVQYNWDFGDGGTATGATANHTYAADNTYNITLTVTDNGGATDSDIQPVVIASGGFAANLIYNPSLGGYPDATNTGVPAGTTLSASGGFTVTQAGALIENLDISGEVTINADNVIIRNCRITTGGYYPIINNGTNLLVEDCEIVGLSSDVTSCISFNNYTARRVNAHGAADGFKADSDVLIEDCFVHDLAIGVDTHNDGTQTTGGANVTIRHNTYRLGDVAGVSACIQVGNEWGINSNWLIENNLFDGGGWVINASSDPADNLNFQVLNNRFTRRAGYGPGGIGGAVWSGNYYDDDGSPA